MKLDELLSIIQPLSVQGNSGIEISALSEDSRQMVPGTLFFARKGSKVSGLNYALEAIQKGAAAIITEEENPEAGVPVVRVRSISEAQAKLAAAFYGFPSKKILLIGVTGTNGKTTYTYLLESIAKEMGWRVGVVGTVNYRVPKLNDDEIEILPAPNTTPNALELQKLFRLYVERKTDLVVMEVSSHALSLGRTDGVEFDGAVFTNLTQDHLDFHQTIENYFEAKSKLFKMMTPEMKKGIESSAKVKEGKFSIINLDDPFGKRMSAFSAVPAQFYTIRSDAEFAAKEIILSDAGSRFQFVSPEGKIAVRLSLIGEHNIYNALAAGATAVQLGIPLPKIAKGLEKIKLIPGRLEPVDCGQNFTVLVDYAHTEDALKNVLASIRRFAKKRILTLFGCGGDRDRSKRPLMGAIATQMSDWVIVTSDNSRSEDPKKIALDVEVGIQRIGKKNFEVIIDREDAIRKILEMAKKDDIVLLAGKGHETYQIFADRTIHFDDREVARQFLSKS